MDAVYRSQRPSNLSTVVDGIEHQFSTGDAGQIEITFMGAVFMADSIKAGAICIPIQLS
jgi:hypothetical protein